MVNVLVCIKYAIDPQQIKFDPKTLEPLIEETPRKMSDMDKRALEEGLKIKGELGGKVIVVSVGFKEADRIIRDAYAVGADEGYLIDTQIKNADTLVVSEVLASFVKKINEFDLILCGAASTDGYTSLIGPRIAKLLGIPILPYARRVSVTDEKVTVESVFEDGTNVIESGFPAIVTVTIEANEPRIPKLSGILRSKRMPVNVLNLKNLDIKELESTLKITYTKLYEVKRLRKIIDASDAAKIDEALDELVAALRERALQ